MIGQPRRRSRRLFATLAWPLAAMLGGCPQPAEPVDLGGLNLTLWQVPSPGDEPFLDRAQSVEIDVTIDGTTTTETVEDGTVSAIETAPEGADVALVLRVTGAFGEALARPAPFTVAPDGGTIERRAILAQPGVTVLDTAAPDGRTQAAVCGDGDGMALVVGGQQGGALSFGSFVLDTATESVREGPGLIARRVDAACVIVDDTAWLFGGCDLDQTALQTLERSPLSGGPFSVGGDPPPSDTGCGSALAPTDEGFLLLYGNLLQARDRDGIIIDQVIIPQRRYFANIARHPGGGVFVAGGWSQIGGTLAGDVGWWWTKDGEVEPVAGLGGGALLAQGVGELFALTDDRRLVVLTADGTFDERLSADRVNLNGERPTSMVASADGRVWVITDGGAAVYELGGGAGTEATPLSPARPGARLVAGPGGSAWLIGGANGALLLQPD